MTDFRYDDKNYHDPNQQQYQDDDEQQHQANVAKQQQLQRNMEHFMKEDKKQQQQQQAQPPAPKKQGGSQQQSLQKRPPIPPSSDGSNKAKLIEQHIKLKAQLKQLAIKMDEILVKERERRKKKLNPGVAEQDQRVREIKNQLKQQELEIQKNKALILQLRKNLENKYDINKIVQKEDELKLLKKQLQMLEREKESLEKIRKQQQDAMRTSEDEETKRKYERMKADLAELTQKNRKYLESINQKEKQLRKLHQNYIVKEQKIKEIEAKIKERKNNPAAGAAADDINQYTISQLEDNIKELEKQKQDVERQGNDKIRLLEKQKKQLKQQADRKKLILEEKQKQLRLNQIKYREIVRLINSNNNAVAKESSNANKEAVSKDQASVAEAAKNTTNAGKRVIDKKGRAPPKMDLPVEEAAPATEDQHLVDKIPKKKEGHEVGVGGNLDDYDEYADDFAADDDVVAAQKKQQPKKQQQAPAPPKSPPKKQGGTVFTKPVIGKKS